MGLPCPDGDVGASRRIGELQYLYQEREICMYEWIERMIELSVGTFTLGFGALVVVDSVVVFVVN